MKIKNRQDFLVVLAVAVLALYLGVLFVFTPLQNWWTERQGQVKQLHDQVAAGTLLLRRETTVRGRWEEMQRNALPARSSDAEQEFLKALTAWSRDSRAAITSIMPQWKNDSTNYMTLNCRVETDGDLGALTRFIYDIEQGPMAVRLDSLELSTHDNDGQLMTLGLEINGLALLQTDKK
jgi:Tfp pilus assembly protein PilO